MKTEEWPIGRLIEYESNPRHNDHAVAAVAAAIKEFGFRVPIVALSSGQVVDGHLRLKAARTLKLETVPIVLADDMTPTQIKAFRVAVNQVATIADWDFDLLRVELEGLADDNFDLGLLGFDDQALAAILEPDEVPGKTDPDAVPPTPATPVTALGDVWLLGNHRVMCGDSTEVTAVERLMAGQRADLVFTDPPYGISVVAKDGSLGKAKYREVLGDEDNSVAADAFRLCRALDIPELFFWGANHYASALPDSSCWLVWDKQGGKSVTFADCELCYTSLKQPVRMFTHIWDGFRRDSERGEKRVHPTQKPVALFTDIWGKFNTGSKVLDLFGGSGSTLIACEKSNRRCYMRELDPRYVDVIVKRWQDFTGQIAVNEAGYPFPQ